DHFSGATTSDRLQRHQRLLLVRITPYGAGAAFRAASQDRAANLSCAARSDAMAQKHPTKLFQARVTANTRIAPVSREQGHPATLEEFDRERLGIAAKE